MTRSQPFNPQPGDFCLVTTKPRYVSWAIRVGEALNGDGFGHWVTEPDGTKRFEGFSHAFLVIGQGQVVEAEPGGAVISALAPYRDTTAGGSFVSSTWDLTDQQRETLCANALTRVGVGYSALDYVELASHRLHVPVPGLRQRIAASGRQICSQQVDWIYTASNLHLFQDNRWEGDVTPMNLFAALTGPVTARP